MKAVIRYQMQCLAQYFLANAALDKDAPTTRAVQSPGSGPIVAHAHLDGLHHHYERRAA